MKKKETKNGVIYTPDYIAGIMLNLCGYLEYDDSILNKHIIDNCCGNGAFLCECVRRYIHTMGGHCSFGTLCNNLSNYIHGIEIDNNAIKECYQNLRNTVIEEIKKSDTFSPAGTILDIHLEGIQNIYWDIRYGDTFKVDDYDGKMDFVVANPPYINAHDIDKETLAAIKKMKLTSESTTDVYLAFFERGFDMLNKTGRMCYITPSQWMNNKAGRELRKYILEKKNLIGVVDFAEMQVFDGVQTYVMISSFNANGNTENNPTIIYQMPSKKINKKVPYSSLTEEKFAFDADLIHKEIENYSKNNAQPHVSVKNGVATLLDKFFIKNIPDVECKYIIPIYKASKGTWARCFFPYHLDTLELASLDEIRKESEELYEYVVSHKEELLKRNLDTSCADYYAFGRRQAISQTNKRRIAINTLVKEVSNIKLAEIKPGACIYSGYYFETELSVEKIKSILNEDFITYIEGLKRYKSKGYFTFTSKELENFINFKLSQE